MPYLVNGSGTHYYGKQNVVKRHDVCEQCGSEVEIISYDTTLYFVLFMIPILPLGKKRVIDYCSACTRHKIFKLKDWEKLKAEVLEKGVSEFKKKPDDQDTANTFIWTLRSLQLSNELELYEPEIKKYHQDEITVISNLAYSWFYFGMKDKSLQTWREAHRIDQDAEEPKENIARILMWDGDIPEATRFAKHAIEGKDSTKVWLVYQLAEANQMEGNHEEAVRLFEKIAIIDPEIESNKQYKKDLKKSRKLIGSNKPIKKPNRQFNSFESSDKSGFNFGGKVAAVIPVIIFLLIFGGYFFTAWNIGKSRDVIVYNGLSKPYLVSINDQIPVYIKGHSKALVQVAEGELEIKLELQNYDIETQKVELKTNFFTRPFNNDTFIINPDKAALIEKEYTWYMAGSPTDSESASVETEYYGGQVLYNVGEIDYLFQEFPNQISLSGTDRAKKNRLSIISPDKVFYSRGYNGTSSEDVDRIEIITSALKNQYLYDRNKTDALISLAWFLEPQELIHFLNPFLDERPIDISLHKQWIVAKTNEGLGNEALQYYYGLLDQGSNDPNVYLLASIASIDPFEKEKNINSGLAANPNHLELIYEKAEMAFRKGDFEEAFLRFDQYWKRESDFSTSRLNSLYGYYMIGERYTESLAVLSEMMKNTSEDVTLYFDRACLYALMGNKNEARQDAAFLKNYYTKLLNSDFGNMYQKMTENYIDVAEEGCENVYREIHQSGVSEQFKPYLARLLFQSHLFYDDIDEIESLLMNNMDSLALSDLAILAVILKRKGETDREQEILNQIYDYYLYNEQDYQMFYHLTNESDYSAEQHLVMECSFDNRMPLLFLMGEYDVKNRELFWDMARKINTDRFSGDIIYEQLMDNPDGLLDGELSLLQTSN